MALLQARCQPENATLASCGLLEGPATILYICTAGPRACPVDRGKMTPKPGSQEANMTTSSITSLLRTVEQTPSGETAGLLTPAGDRAGSDRPTQAALLWLAELNARQGQ